MLGKDGQKPRCTLLQKVNRNEEDQWHDGGKPLSSLTRAVSQAYRNNSWAPRVAAEAFDERVKSERFWSAGHLKATARAAPNQAVHIATA